MSGLLERLRLLEKALADGRIPWTVQLGPPRSEEARVLCQGFEVCFVDGRQFLGEKERAALIAEMRNALPLLLAVVDAGNELRLWEPGRRGWAAAYRRFTDALDRLDKEEK